MGYSRPEPLRGKHSLNGFACGEESLDVWLTRHARQAEATDSARVFVTAENEQVVGYYALVGGEVDRSRATERLLKGQPAKAEAVPIVILARLAVDNRHKGKGLGRSLLQDALLRCATAVEAVAARALVAHAISDEARSFYLGFGFEESPTDPFHLILLTKDLRQLLAETERQTR